MELSVSYGVTFGKCDSSEWMEYGEADLSEEETAAAIGLALTGGLDEILNLDELKETYDYLYSEIEAMEIENNLDNEDEYTMECQGRNEMDADELNDLVLGKDEHALKFFNLEDASDEDIENWDADDLDELPTVADFNPDFEPESPFDYGWCLNISATDAFIDDDELTDYLKKLFENNDFETINEIKDWCTLDFDRPVEDIIMDVAKEVGCKEYIEKYSDDKD